MIISKERLIQIDNILKNDENKMAFVTGIPFEQFVKKQIEKRNKYYSENIIGEKMAGRKDLKAEDKLYVHYGSSHFDKHIFQKAKNPEFGIKPEYGLWGSPVNSEYGWKHWCEENGFRECSDENCFYFRIRGWQVYEIESKEDLSILPHTENDKGYKKLYPNVAFLDYEAIGSNSYPYSALDISIKDLGEYLPGYDCDCIFVLDDYDLVENYDAKITDKPLTLRQLLPMKWYKTICGDIELSALCKSPDGKHYVYCEQPDIHYGFKTLVAGITDGRIVETCGYTETEAKEIIAEVVKYKDDIDELIVDNGITVR